MSFSKISTRKIFAWKWIYKINYYDTWLAYILWFWKIICLESWLKQVKWNTVEISLFINDMNWKINKILIPFPHNGRQEYTELMKIVYRFALGDADEYELVIGNIMRQVLKHFLHFNTKRYWGGFYRSKYISNTTRKEYQSYFENLMYRLILNNGSHRLIKTRSMSDMNFYSNIWFGKRKGQQKKYCFIYLLNEKHVLAHLDGCSNVQSNLSKWCNDVKIKWGLRYNIYFLRKIQTYSTKIYIKNEKIRINISLV